MKTFTLLTMMVALTGATALAQDGMVPRPWQQQKHDQSTKIQCIDRKAQPGIDLFLL